MLARIMSDAPLAAAVAELNALRAGALGEIAAAADPRALEELRVRLLGRKGPVAAMGPRMRDLPKEARPELGRALNECREGIAAALAERAEGFQGAADAAAAASVDATLPGRPPAWAGARHPLSRIMAEAIASLRRMGFAIAEGPEIEDERHCFDALNTPADHPAREAQDTFYFADGRLLRTHTSSVQIRAMEEPAARPPLRVIAPGAAFRRDAVDATHLSCFTQLEGLHVDAAGAVSAGDLKGVLERLYRELFGEGTRLRLRPHFFPFTEPSWEVDIQLRAPGRAARWMEVCGCGMVDPAVLESVSAQRGDAVFAPGRVEGFAFGMGIERLAMIRWGIGDIRALVENDARFLGRFAGL